MSLGLLGVSSGGYEMSRQYNLHPRNPRHAALEYAITEINVGSHDSIQLAVDTLRLESIEIPSLNSLLNLLNARLSYSEQEFHQKSDELQKEAILEIQKLLK